VFLDYPLHKLIRLENSLVPKVFKIINDEIYFFDAINKHEGRFCKRNEYMHIILEVEVPFGIITEVNMYSIDMGINTIIKEFDLDGNFKQEFLLDGTFYDLAIDDAGNYIFLGLVNKRSCIEIYNKNGIRINSFELINIVLGYGIYIEKDYLYIGGVDESDIIKLLLINYMGIIKKEWSIYYPGKSKTIDRILGCGAFIILLFRGETNNIVILNKINEKKVEIFPEEMGLEEFSDINIYAGRVYILDLRDIYITSMDDILNHVPQKKLKKSRMNINWFSYIYMMCFLEFYYCFLSIIKLTIIIDVLIYTSIFLYGHNIFETDKRKILIGISMCYFAPFLFTMLLGIKHLISREERIHRLIEINDHESLKWIGWQVLIALLAFFIITLMFSFDYYQIILCLIFCLLLSIYAGSIFLNNVRVLKNDMIVELLFEENLEYINYIKTILSRMKENSVNDIYINIITENLSFKDITEEWRISRRGILKQDVNIQISNKKITAVIDLSKRDIRYSKLSILMDYICYIKSKIDIKEIELLYYEFKNEL
jgi:hypothetical protein